MDEQESAHLRGIKSYVVRGGRLTSSQRQAMEGLWPKYGLDLEDGIIERERIFGRNAELVFEIGFGMGDSLIKMAEDSPHQDFIGVDVHPPGIGTLLREIGEHGLENLRVYQSDATIILRDCVEDSGLDKVQIFFPDPWHKKRHHKRRLIQASFVRELWKKLKVGGILHLATDWENYAEQMMTVMSTDQGFANASGDAMYAAKHCRPSTKFERRGERLGHGVWDLIFVKR